MEGLETVFLGMDRRQYSLLLSGQGNRMYVLRLTSDHAVLIGRLEKVKSHTSHRNVGRFRNPKQLEVLLRPLMRCYSVAGIPPAVFRRGKNFLSKKTKDSRDLQATDHPPSDLKSNKLTTTSTSTSRLKSGSLNIMCSFSSYALTLVLVPSVQ